LLLKGALIEQFLQWLYVPPLWVALVISRAIYWGVLNASDRDALTMNVTEESSSQQ
jgi:hypothetical protein